MESILNDIKKLLGIDPEYTVFDTDIIIHINSVFMILNQLGVGPDGGYKIVDSSNTWTEFTQDNLLIESVKSYIYLKVRMMFDPPQNSSYMNAIQSQIQELEWRLNVASSEV